MWKIVEARAAGKCEFCQSADALAGVSVPPNPDQLADRAVWLCETCRSSPPADEPHWRCLGEAVWSEVPAVQVAAWRALQRIPTAWATDLSDSVWMDDEQRQWALEGLDDPDRVPTVDSNGSVLADGDSVTLVKDLDVKGAGFTAKRGTMVKNIRLTDDPGLIEGRVKKTAVVLKTEFLKRA